LILVLGKQPSVTGPLKQRRKLVLNESGTLLLREVRTAMRRLADCVEAVSAAPSCGPLKVLADEPLIGLMERVYGVAAEGHVGIVLVRGQDDG
jgi:DNA-binding transcriptional LysR family regulator